MRKAFFILIVSFLTAVNAPAQKIIPKTEGERRGAESYNKAVEAYSAGDYAASIQYFLAADSLIGPKGVVPRAKLRFALATAYLQSRQPAKAFQWFALIAAEDSTFPFVNYQAAESARLASMAPEALKQYRLALLRSDAKQKAPILQRIGELQEKSGELKGALETYSQALAIEARPQIFLLRGQIYDRLAQPVDHAEDNEFNVEAALKDSTLTVTKIESAIELRQKALADYRAAAVDPALGAAAGKLAERSEMILQNNRIILSEIKYQKENEE